MSEVKANDGLGLVDGFAEQLNAVADQTTAREQAFAEALLRISEQWHAWRTEWQERLQHLDRRQEDLQGACTRAAGLVEEAETGLQEIETALQEWLAAVKKLSR